VVLEALWCGCFPIVTDRDGMLEVTGDIGMKVPYGNIEMTRNAIEEALSSKIDPEQMRNQARLFSKERKKKSIEKILSMMENN
jgi:glycosyltransferase involved in cell wall biosynthesis